MRTLCRPPGLPRLGFAGLTDRLIARDLARSHRARLQPCRWADLWNSAGPVGAGARSPCWPSDRTTGGLAAGPVGLARRLRPVPLSLALANCQAARADGPLQPADQARQASAAGRQVASWAVVNPLGSLRVVAWPPSAHEQASRSPADASAAVIGGCRGCPRASRPPERLAAHLGCPYRSAVPSGAAPAALGVGRAQPERWSRVLSPWGTPGHRGWELGPLVRPACRSGASERHDPLAATRRLTVAVHVLWGRRVGPQRLSPSDGRSALARREHSRLCLPYSIPRSCDSLEGGCAPGLWDERPARSA